MAKLKVGTTIGGRDVMDEIDTHVDAAAPHSGHETVTGATEKVAAHANLTNNPHGVTKAQVGLGSVSNYGIATQAEAEAGTSSSKYMTPQRTKQAIDELSPVKSVAGKTGTVTLSKSDVGLGNVDNAKQATKSEFDTHADTSASISTLGHVNHAVISTTLNTTWSGSSAPYSQTVSVSGIQSTDVPIIDVVMSGTYSTDEQRIEAWGKIYRAVTSNGQITFYATEKPTVSLPIQIKVVR